ncbi:glycosyltransferase family 1 protein [Ralstonia sp. ASV6]|uniref:glycosyltransferase family 4 protein n=1 Tax=Ralstonia sp. ASV6 TaxID=2795124 RepID=UPI001E31894A|nr:glycosyltransferase family 1 protein [Ralstonia sp. ASV6]
MFFDVTELAGFDKGTGIQRVTRALLLAVSRSCPSDWQVVPVVGDGVAGVFRSVPSMLSGDRGITEENIEPLQGDIFLSVDLAYNITPSLRQELVRFRGEGVCIYFVVYDLVPLMYPEWFEGTNAWFEGNDYLDLFSHWFECASEEADGLICISDSVRQDVRRWLETHKPRRAELPQLGYFYLGSDISESVPTKGLPQDVSSVLGRLRAAPTFLMVGTLEPRKGHELALDAVEGLWAEGADVNLVMVGREGWKIERLAQRLKEHPELGKKLFWLDGISDEYLREIYSSASVLLALSLAEGFGLPLVEAARFGVPLIVRDIPVFREICGAGATYFQGKSNAELRALLREWLHSSHTGSVSCVNSIKVHSWRESAEQLMSALGKMRGEESFWGVGK